MKWFCSLGLIAGLASAYTTSTRADDQDPKAIVDKGIKALGGEEKLTKAQTGTWKAKGKFYFGDNESPLSSEGTVDTLEHYRSEFKGKFGDNDITGVVVVNGEKGWRKINDDKTEFDENGLAAEKTRVVHLMVPMTLVPLKANGFKLEAAGEEKIGDKPAVAIKATGKDGKSFKLYFDKESGLPVKLVADVTGFDGAEFTMETTISDYKDFDGIKRATKIVSTRDGNKLFEQEFTEFKVLDKAPAGAFDEPK